MSRHKPFYEAGNTGEIIVGLYQAGNSAQEIKENMMLTVSTRSVQRFLKSKGLARTHQDAFRLAVKKGAVTYHYKPEEEKRRPRRKTLPVSVRYYVLKRDGFACVACGNKAAQTMCLTIDHIDQDSANNKIENLQVLCEDCNVGKANVYDWEQGQNSDVLKKAMS